MLMMLAGMLPCMVLRPPLRDAAKCSGRSDVLGELNTIMLHKHGLPCASLVHEAPLQHTPFRGEWGTCGHVCMGRVNTPQVHQVNHI